MGCITGTLDNRTAALKRISEDDLPVALNLVPRIVHLGGSQRYPAGYSTALPVFFVVSCICVGHVANIEVQQEPCSSFILDGDWSKGNDTLVLHHQCYHVGLAII